MTNINFIKLVLMPYLQRYTQIHILEQQKMCCWKQHITGYVRYKKLGQATIFDFCISVKIGPFLTVGILVQPVNFSIGPPYYASSKDPGFVCFKCLLHVHSGYQKV